MTKEQQNKFAQSISIPSLIGMARSALRIEALAFRKKMTNQDIVFFWSKLTDLSERVKEIMEREKPKNKSYCETCGKIKEK